MSVKVFRLRGTYGERKKKVVFNSEIRAINEKEAKEKLYSELGSRHRIKRHLIVIEHTQIIKDENKITDPIIASLTKGEVRVLRRK